jgi:Ohr subfamily peroxiredoxin
LDIKLATPKELGGAGGAGNNPEQLFAAATRGGPKVPQDTSVTATVGIGPRSEGGFGLDIAIEIALPGLSSADAQSLVDKAHQVCPYSNATRNNVPVRLSIA